MTLLDHINAEEGSFLLELRIQLNWNHDSFIDLITMVLKECQETKNEEKLDREIANGIWYISTFIEDWSQHKDFPRKLPEQYYEKAYELINDLTYEYFMGESLYQSAEVVEKKISDIKFYV